MSVTHYALVNHCLHICWQHASGILSNALMLSPRHIYNVNLLLAQNFKCAGVWLKIDRPLNAEIARRKYSLLGPPLSMPNSVSPNLTSTSALGLNVDLLNDLNVPSSTLYLSMLIQFFLLSGSSSDRSSIKMELKVFLDDKRKSKQFDKHWRSSS